MIIYRLPIPIRQKQGIAFRWPQCCICQDSTGCFLLSAMIVLYLLNEGISHMTQKSIAAIVATGLSLFFHAPVTAQQHWPAITQQNKPWTRWWWEGSAVDQKNLSIAMNEYKNAGLGGLEIVPIYGVKGYEKQFINYLSPQWMAMLDYTLAEGQRLGLGIDMAMGTGWPFGGPWIHEDNAAKTINYKTYHLTGGESLRDKIAFEQEPLVRTAGTEKVQLTDVRQPVYNNTNLQTLALDQIKFPGSFPAILVMAYGRDTSIDLTHLVDRQGVLHWQAPDGEWTIYALFESLHGKMVERAAPGGEGYAMDHYSQQASRHYLQQFDKAFTGHHLQYLRAFFNDSYEVDDARGQASWTPLFLDEFQKRRGYDLRMYLPALFQQADATSNSRVLCDYRITVSDLIYEHYTKAWHSWSAAKGKLVRNQAHGSPGNILDLYAAVDIPETEGREILRFKFASSAANVTGKQLTSSESATWLDEHFLSTLGGVKQAIDQYFLGGVNHIFYHGVNYSPASDPWPGWLFYAAVHFQPTNPFWKDFPALNRYIARCQSFLQQGKPDNDVLLYYPLFDRFADPGKEMLRHFDGMEKEFGQTDFKANAEEMLEKGYSFDYISDLQLQQVQCSGQTLQTGHASYQTIVLPNNRYISLAAFTRLMQLVQQGATVIACKGLPAATPGLHHQDAALQQLIASLHFTTDAHGIQKAVAGKGMILTGDHLDALLQAAAVRKETLPQKGLHFIRRQAANGTLYFISNDNKEKFEGWAPLSSKATAVMLFNAMTGTKGIASTRVNASGGLEIYLQLAPAETVIAYTTNQPLQGDHYPYYQPGGNAVAISGNWTLQFLEGGPSLPATQQLTRLGSWTSATDAQSFSGTAAYSIHFTKPAGKADAWLLNLGEVHDNAEVILNGKKIATLLGPDFSVMLPEAWLQTNNQLEIRVANSMANRIIDMDKKGQPWKKFYNTNMPAKTAQARGADGLFTAANWQPLPSGLTTEVTLTPCFYNK